MAWGGSTSGTLSELRRQAVELEASPATQKRKMVEARVEQRLQEERQQEKQQGAAQPKRYVGCCVALRVISRFRSVSFQVISMPLAGRQTLSMRMQSAPDTHHANLHGIIQTRRQVQARQSQNNHRRKKREAANRTSSTTMAARRQVSIA